MITFWGDMDSETARQADETEAVISEIVKEVFGSDATLIRDDFYGRYLLNWTDPNLGNASETGKPQVEVCLFGPTHTTLPVMLWEAHLGFDDASDYEKGIDKYSVISYDYEGNPRLAVAHAQVSQGIVDYIQEHGIYNG